MQKQFINLLTILVFVLCLAPAGFAQECNSNMAVDTPNERFEDLGNGTVLDTNTKLVWKKCAEGQTYNAQSGGCDGAARLFVFNEALAFTENINITAFAGHDDWRVPNIKELSSIVESSCVMPAINIVVFRNAPSGYFRSSTPTGSDYYCVNFGNGAISNNCHDTGTFYGGMGSMGGAGGAPIYEGYLRFVRNQ